MGLDSPTRPPAQGPQPPPSREQGAFLETQGGSGSGSSFHDLQVVLGRTPVLEKESQSVKDEGGPRRTHVPGTTLTQAHPPPDGSQSPPPPCSRSLTCTGTHTNTCPHTCTRTCTHLQMGVLAPLVAVRQAAMGLGSSWASRPLESARHWVWR